MWEVARWSSFHFVVVVVVVVVVAPNWPTPALQTFVPKLDGFSREEKLHCAPPNISNKDVLSKLTPFWSWKSFTRL